MWINKTHFPLRIPYDKPYKTNVVVCCVRNPLDAFVSVFLLLATLTHNNNVNEKLLEYAEWYRHIELEGKLWKKWIDYWITKSKNREVPVYFCRFEDIISEPMKSLSDIFGFILGQNSIEGTVIE